MFLTRFSFSLSCHFLEWEASKKHTCLDFRKAMNWKMRCTKASRAFRTFSNPCQWSPVLWNKENSPPKRFWSTKSKIWKKTQKKYQHFIFAEQFLQAGDLLTFKCPSWKWQSGVQTGMVKYLRPERQFLITKNGQLFSFIFNEFTWEGKLWINFSIHTQFPDSPAK